MAEGVHVQEGMKASLAVTSDERQCVAVHLRKVDETVKGGVISDRSNWYITFGRTWTYVARFCLLSCFHFRPEHHESRHPGSAGIDL